MALTNYPSGLSSFGVPLIGGGPNSVVTTGLVFFVRATIGNNSPYNPSTTQGTSPDTPFATIAYAIGQCRAAKADVIYVMPGHVETISAAAGIACSISGISIIGLGNGANRPTITFSAVASTWTVTAANVLIKNLVVTCTLATTKMFSVTAANCTLDTIDYVEGAGIPLQFLLTSAAADGITVRDCTHYGATAGASAQLWLQLVGPDNAQILRNVFWLVLFNGATTATINATTAAVKCNIGWNVILQTGGTTQASGILMVASSTGFIHDNRVAVGSTALPGIVAAANCYCAENYCLNTVNTSGILDPVADT